MHVVYISVAVFIQWPGSIDISSRLNGFAYTAFSHLVLFGFCPSMVGRRPVGACMIYSNNRHVIAITMVYLRNRNCDEQNCILDGWKVSRELWPEAMIRIHVLRKCDQINNIGVGINNSLFIGFRWREMAALSFITLTTIKQKWVIVCDEGGLQKCAFFARIRYTFLPINQNNRCRSRAAL